MNKCCLLLFQLSVFTHISAIASEMVVPDSVKICTSCHGIQGQGTELVAPSIAGMSALYLSNQIKLFIPENVTTR